MQEHQTTKKFRKIYFKSKINKNLGFKVVFCSDCGTEITDNSNYCYNCGQNISKYQKKVSAVDMEHSEVVLKDEQLKRVLHEPVAPYVASVYNTQMHLIEGLVLAAIFYVISIYWGQLTPLIVLNLIICFTNAITIWYGYLTVSQYYIMRASVFNTLIIVGTGICQVVLALVVAQSIYIFTLLFIPIITLLTLQFWDNANKNKKPIAFEIWKEHYKVIGKQFAKDLFEEVGRYEKIGVRSGIYFIILIGILTLFNYFFPLDLAIKTYISFIIILTTEILANSYNNLNRFLNKSEKLKKYGYEW